jgi:hypothetical protein
MSGLRPTNSNSSATRPRTSWRESRSCVKIGSPMMSPTRMRGLSELWGSWNTTCTFRKCVLRSRTSNNGSRTFRLLHREPAPDMAPLVQTVLCGLLGTAVVHCMGATGVEATALREG